MPTYPFQRQSYWLGEITGRSSGGRDVGGRLQHFSRPSWGNSRLTPTKNVQSNRVKNKVLKAENAPIVKQPAQPKHYQTEWQLQLDKLEIQVERNDSNHGKWLIFADESGLGAKVAQQLEQQQKCLVISNDPTKRTSDFSKVLTDNPDIQNIIYLWGLEPQDTNLATNLTVEEITSYQEQNCNAILNLVQTLFKQGINAPIWLVTRGNQSVTNQITENIVNSSSLWGLAQAIATEHPEYWGGIVDLDAQPIANEASNLMAAIARSGSEDRLAIRGDKIYVPRLVEIDRLELSTKRLKLNRDSSYLITGGLGALGLTVAQWLIAQGAKHLVLTSRSKPSVQVEAKIAELK